MLELDHIAITAATLEEGAGWVEAMLGVPLQPGGVHPLMGTHNRLLSLGPGLYLEVIATDPSAPKPPHPRWFSMDDFAGPPRITNWIARVPDLDAALAAAPVGAGRAVQLERGDYRWRMGIPDDGRLPFDDAFPALIEWQGDLHPADRLTDQGFRLLRLEIAHPDAAALQSTLAMRDERLTFHTGPKAIRATIATPKGERVLA